ncbi:MAG: hypothetical protein J6W10_00470 [Kiritimatiellae bacterium]|nr:hypothetical protein [Kiritimatiellia bacterium]
MNLIIVIVSALFVVKADHKIKNGNNFHRLRLRSNKNKNGLAVLANEPDAYIDTVNFADAAIDRRFPVVGIVGAGTTDNLTIGARRLSVCRFASVFHAV